MYESARAIITDRIGKLKNQLTSVDTEIRHHQQELKQLKESREALIVQMKEVAGGLQALGGPLPDWTDDRELIAFWDEVISE